MGIDVYAYIPIQLSMRKVAIMSACSLLPYRASKELEDFMETQAGPYYICAEGTCMPDLDALRRWKEKHGDARFDAPIPVYPRSPDSPFSERGDAAYQAWHDRLHAEHEYEFNICGELKLAGHHMALAKRAGLSDEDVMFLYHFIVSRVCYHYYHNSEEPLDRARFISACFLFGCRAAARGDHELQYSDYFV